MVKVIIRSDPGEFQRFMSSPQGEPFRLVQRAVDDADVRSRAWARRLMTVRTGNLMNSHVKSPVVVQGKKLVAGLENTAKYAMFVHEGTRAHPIRPRRVKMLTWINPGGQQVFARGVMHPGTKPRPWLLMTAQEVGRRHGFIVTKG